MTVSAPKLILRCKVAVVGDAAVGKSAVVQSFHSEGSHFPKSYAMTIGAEFLVKVVNIPETDVAVELHIFDVAGHEVFHDLATKYCEDASALVVVYDVASLESFKAVIKHHQRFMAKLRPAGAATSPSAIPAVLLGNKADLQARRVVNPNIAQELARANGMEFFECSALSNTDVDAPFFFIANAFYRSYEEQVASFSAATAGLSS